MPRPETDTPSAEIDRLAIDTLRFLAVDMVEAANSGHPGAPMGQAPLAYRLFTKYMRHDPSAPDWANRDRFVLSCGHASALIYSLLHLSGYDLSLDELRAFRQLGSKTPGHPEHKHTAGVETTTGPLGQGLANAVGMALGERYTAHHLNRDGFELLDWRTWVIASDGDLMEGMTAEASSFAGHQRLGKLNVFWDDNRISIDGSTDLAFTEDVLGRYRAYGWHVLEVDDVNDLAAVDAAIEAAAAETERPTLVRVRTSIGYGAPNKQGTASAHGSPLGEAERKAAKENLGWPLEPTFHIPDAAREAFADAGRRGAEAHAEWREQLERFRSENPDAADRFEAWSRGDLVAEAGEDGETVDWRDAVPTFAESDGPIATRAASGKVIEALAPHLPQLLGGSADLSGSNNTFVKGRDVQAADAPGGGNVLFGVREHAMGAILNGMALSGMLRPYGGTFLVFADYMRAAVRLAALMRVPSVFVFTHDSIFLGEDGPTHQPVGQLASLRAIPDLCVFRPADANETAAAWRLALEATDRPSALVLTRQKLPIPDCIAEGTRGLPTEGVARGGYVVRDTGDPRVLLIATGSEVHLALEAQTRLEQGGIDSRVVSLPCWRLFAEQDAAYRESVLPRSIRARVGIEAGSSFGWERFVGLDGDVVAQDGFGASAPASDLAEHFGFTPEAVAERARAVLDRLG